MYAGDFKSVLLNSASCLGTSRVFKKKMDFLGVAPRELIALVLGRAQTAGIFKTLRTSQSREHMVVNKPDQERETGVPHPRSGPEASGAGVLFSVTAEAESAG